MARRSPVRNVARLAGVVAVGGVVWLSSAGAAGAAALPDPLGDALTSVTGQSLPAAPQLPVQLPVQPPAQLPVQLTPQLPVQPGSPAPPAPPALPGLPGQEPTGGAQGDQGDRGASAEVQAPAGDDRVAVEAAVAQFLGVCARVPQDVVPVRATVVVLDRDVIAELVDAGVPLRPLVVPCPKPAGDPASAPQSAVPGATAQTPGGPADARSGLPASLAFTGTDLAPTLLLAGGLIALGLGFLRKAHLLAVVR